MTENSSKKQRTSGEEEVENVEKRTSTDGKDSNVIEHVDDESKRTTKEGGSLESDGSNGVERGKGENASRDDSDNDDDHEGGEGIDGDGNDDDHEGGEGIDGDGNDDDHEGREGGNDDDHGGGEGGDGDGNEDDDGNDDDDDDDDDDDENDNDVEKEKEEDEGEERPYCCQVSDGMGRFDREHHGAKGSKAGNYSII